jgi:hypothetical protein
MYLGVDKQGLRMGKLHWVLPAFLIRMGEMIHVKKIDTDFSTALSLGGLHKKV